MNHFGYVRADSVEHAIRALRGAGARVLAGGTNMVDLMKYDVATAATLVDVNSLPLRSVDALPDGGLRLGALVTNADAAHHSLVMEHAPLVASAILAGASPQLRNMATTGGNLLQRTRCAYFYDPAMACNKRRPGSGCPAREGINRMHAILGASEHCVATHPSDLCVALAALDATVNVQGPQGTRSIPMGEFHRLPGDQPERDTTLEPDELILSVDLPRWRYGEHFSYLKIRDRLSYAFALVSVAAALELDGDRIVSARIAVGGVAHKPWRREEAEAALTGQRCDQSVFENAAQVLLTGAVPLAGNAFKVELARRAIVRTLAQAAAGTPQSQSDKRVR